MGLEDNTLNEKVTSTAAHYHDYEDTSKDEPSLRVIKAFRAGVKSDVAKEYHHDMTMEELQLLQEENQKMKVIFEKLHYFMKDGTINRPYKLEKSLFEKVCEVLGKDKPVVKLQLETDAD